MGEFQKRILWTVVLLPVSTTAGYVVQKMLETWGVLDPLADTLGAWLKTHIMPAQAEWTAATIMVLALYGAALWLIWRSHDRI